MDGFQWDVKKRLLVFCAENRIKQNKIVAGVGTARQSVNRWFKLDNETMPSIAAIGWLRENYGLDNNWLLGGEQKGGE